MTKVYETQEEEIEALEDLESRMFRFNQNLRNAKTPFDIQQLRKELLGISSFFIESCPYEDLIGTAKELYAEIDRQITEKEKEFAN